MYAPVFARGRRVVPLGLPAATEASPLPSLTLLFKNGACAPVIHDQQNEVSCLTADLETNAAAFQSHHCRRAHAVRVVITF